MAESLFDQDGNLPPVEDKNYLEELVGENKKFKTPEDLAKGKAEADAYINTLLAQQDDMRKDYLALKEESAARAALQDLLDRMEKQQDNVNNNQPPVNNEIPPSLKADDVEKMVSKQLTELETRREQEANYALVSKTLKERYGNNVKSVLNSQKEALGLTDDEVNTWARKSPQAFFRLMGLNQTQQQENFQAPVRNERRSDTFAPQVQKRTLSYYEELRKKDPTEYFSPKSTIQRHKDAQALGEAFFDTD